MLQAVLFGPELVKPPILGASFIFSWNGAKPAGSVTLNLPSSEVNGVLPTTSVLGGAEFGAGAIVVEPAPPHAAAAAAAARSVMVCMSEDFFIIPLLPSL